MIKYTIYDFLNYIGVSLNADSPPIMFLACGILILALFCLLSFLTMLTYIITIYICEHEYLLNKISDKPRLLKFINFYRNIRIIYLGLEVVFFL